MFWMMGNITSFGALVKIIGCDGVVVKRVWWRSERSGPAGGKWLLLLLWRTLQQLKQLCPFFRGFLEPRTKKFGAVFTNFLSSSARSWMFSRLLPPQLAVGKDHTGGIHTGRDHTGRGGTALGGSTLGETTLGGTTLGGTALGGTALGGSTLGDWEDPHWEGPHCWEGPHWEGPHWAAYSAVHQHPCLQNTEICLTPLSLGTILLTSSRMRCIFALTPLNFLQMHNATAIRNNQSGESSISARSFPLN